MWKKMQEKYLPNFLSTKILEQKIFEGQKIFGVKTNFWDQKVFSGKKIW